jgi:hypothetical protein
MLPLPGLVLREMSFNIEIIGSNLYLLSPVFLAGSLALPPKHTRYLEYLYFCLEPSVKTLTHFLLKTILQFNSTLHKIGN